MALPLRERIVEVPRHDVHMKMKDALSGYSALVDPNGEARASCGAHDGLAHDLSEVHHLAKSIRRGREEVGVVCFRRDQCVALADGPVAQERERARRLANNPRLRKGPRLVGAERALSWNGSVGHNSSATTRVETRSSSAPTAWEWRRPRRPVSSGESRRPSSAGDVGRMPEFPAFRRSRIRSSRSMARH